MDTIKNSPLDKMDVYKCPICGNSMVDPAPGTEAKALQRAGYERWQANGKAAHAPGTPCWFCQPLAAAVQQAQD